MLSHDIGLLVRYLGRLRYGRGFGRFTRMLTEKGIPPLTPLTREAGGFGCFRMLTEKGYFGV